MMQYLGVIIGGVITLVGVILLIRNIIRNYRSSRRDSYASHLNDFDDTDWHMEELDDYEEEAIFYSRTSDSTLSDLGFSNQNKRHERPTSASTVKKHQKLKNEVMVVNVLAKPPQRFNGYEVLQALTSLDMHFGEMNIFHRYYDNGDQNAIMFSAASATEPGTFDLEKLGSQNFAGICLFMQLTGNNDDLDNFEIFLATASQLAEELDGQLMDGKREPLTDEKIVNHRVQIRANLNETITE